MKNKCSREFVTFPNGQIVEIAKKHAGKIENNPVLKNPAYTATQITALNQTFSDAIVAATGDPQDTAVMNTAKVALLDAMRANASSVEALAPSLQTVLSCGFDACSANRAQSPLDQPVILELSNLAPTQLLLRLTPIVNAKSYQVQTSLDGGKTWQEAIISPKAIRIVLEDLPSASTVTVRARAVGGSTGYSPWCTSGSIVVT
jgi:hypothetical protein